MWYYKTAGPFSIPGHADGGYCVLLAVEFLCRLHSLQVTPSYCFIANGEQGKKLEADFGILWQESLFGSVAEGVIFGECKTFDTFEQKDFVRMRTIGKRFPGAVLAFCTLRKELNKRELREITRIAKAGRKRWKSERPLNPVLILTGNELLSDFGPPSCWRENGPSKRFDRVHGLLEICDATQQIYHDLPSRDEQLRLEYEKRNERRVQNAKAQSAKTSKV